MNQPQPMNQAQPMLRDKPVADYPKHIQDIYEKLVNLYIEANNAKQTFEQKNSALVELDKILGEMIDSEEKKDGYDS